MNGGFPEFGRIRRIVSGKGSAYELESRKGSVLARKGSVLAFKH
jgi:hypothetical protein